jgi:multidrug efflux pump subunit AcrA (membrane-fusion protein)
VWIVDPRTSTVSFRRVQLAGIGEESAAIAQGLQPGDRIVAMGAHLLRAGERVRVAAASTITPAAAAQ